MARALATVDLPSVRNPSHDDDPRIVVYGIHDPVLAYTYSVIVSTREFDRSRRPRVACESIDGVGDTRAEWAL